MKVTQRNRPIVFALLFFLISFALPFLAVAFCMLLQARADRISLYASNFVFFLANWPSILLNLYPTITGPYGTTAYDLDHGFLNYKVITANAFGWSLVGLIFGSIMTIIKERKK